MNINILPFLSPAYIPYPEWIRPEIIRGLPLHWYGLMYIIAFGITYILFRYQAGRGELTISSDDSMSFFIWTIMGLLIGARILAVTVYDPTGRYLLRPWLIFWPFDSNMQLTGLQGMSYHGGLIGAFVGAILFCKLRKFSFLQLADAAVAGIPLGYTFGRLGNFINGELWGRVTTRPWGIVFPHAPRFSTTEPWVREIADAVGMEYQPGALLNLPRHPSQLYEAFFEGIFLWLILWFIFRVRKKFHGALLGIYLMGYGMVRFFIEYLREPDADIGFPISFASRTEPSALFLSPWNISMGQILSFLMILAGGAFLLYLHLQNERRVAAGELPGGEKVFGPRSFPGGPDFRTERNTPGVKQSRPGKQKHQPGKISSRKMKKKIEKTKQKP